MHRSGAKNNNKEAVSMYIPIIRPESKESLRIGLTVNAIDVAMMKIKMEFAILLVLFELRQYLAKNAEKRI